MKTKLLNVAALAAITILPAAAPAGAQERHRQGTRGEDHQGDQRDRRDRDDRYDRDGRHDRHDRFGRHHRHRDGRDPRHLRRTAVLLETASDRFERSLDFALRRGHWNGSRRDGAMLRHARHLEAAADRLKEAVRHGRLPRGLAEDLLSHAAALDDFMHRRRLDRRAQRDWMRVERELDAVARHFGLRHWRDRFDDRRRRGGRRGR